MSSLESAFHCINDNSAVPDLVNVVEESLTPETENCKNMTHFTNAIMSSKIKIKGEKNLIYNLTIWRKNYAFGIINGISENVTLVQLMGALVNVNHAISIVGH